MWAVVFTALWIGWLGWRIVNAYSYDIHCGGHLKRAADANTVPLAKQELDIAIKYLETTFTAEQLEHGNTGVFMSHPANDIGFFYKNLKMSQVELNSVNPRASQLEKSNILMKLRETLLDNNQNGQQVTAPDGISIFPLNVGQFWFAWIMIIVAGIFWTLTFKFNNDYY
jgi:hypothetical protein